MRSHPSLTMLLQWIRKLFSGRSAPARRARTIAGAGSIIDMERRLDDLITCNEVEFRTLRREVEALEREELEEEKSLERAGLGERARALARLRIEQLRRQQEALEARLRILHGNLELHLDLLGRLQALEAMELRGVEEHEIDAVAVALAGELESRTAVVAAQMEHGRLGRNARRRQAAAERQRKEDAWDS
jgi:hypothetical protein